MIICIGADGRVAETGSYQELIKKEDGAFNKLMEWQQSSGDQQVKSGARGAQVTEEEELAYREVNGQEHEDQDEVKKGESAEVKAEGAKVEEVAVGEKKQ